MSFYYLLHEVREEVTSCNKSGGKEQRRFEERGKDIRF